MFSFICFLLFSIISENTAYIKIHQLNEDTRPTISYSEKEGLIRKMRLEEARQLVEIEQGYNFTVTCSLTNMEILQVLRLQIKTENEDMTVTDNIDVKQPFSEFERYKIEYDYHPQNTVLKLHYIGIMGEDSGVLECINLPRSKVSLDLNVIVPLTGMSIRYRGSNLSPGAMIECKEGELLELNCTAWAISTKNLVNINISIGDYNVDSALSHRITPIRGDSLSTLIKYNSSTTASFRSIVQPYKFHGKDFLCQANTHPIFEATSVAVRIAVLFKPKIVCSKEIYKVKLHDSINLTCEVDSNPEPQIRWYNKHGELRANKVHAIKLKPRRKQNFRKRQQPHHDGDQFKHFYNKANNNHRTRLNNTKFTVYLFITKMREGFFGSYTIEAKNEIGVSNTSISVHRVPRSPRPTSRRKNSSRLKGRIKTYTSTGTRLLSIRFFLIIWTFLIIS